MDYIYWIQPITYALIGYFIYKIVVMVVRIIKTAMKELRNLRWALYEMVLHNELREKKILKRIEELEKKVNNEQEKAKEI